LSDHPVQFFTGSAPENIVLRIDKAAMEAIFGCCDFYRIVGAGLGASDKAGSALSGSMQPVIRMSDAITGITAALSWIGFSGLSPYRL